MTRSLRVALFAFFLPFAATAASAGAIERACMKSGAQAASPGVCSCIQQIADQTLTGGDQRRAAKLFVDPDEAQNVRMSKSNSDNAFWARYKNFGETAEVYCAG